ncbi:MAG: hypothetical protein KA419_09675 [Acidobacteria bacterium]|nr:hypothetical protein [Acidobacteriota bacterium]
MKNRITYLLTGLLAVCFFTTAVSAFSLTIYFGAPPNCRGFGLCRIVIDTRADGANADAALRGGQMKIRFLQPPPETALLEQDGRKVLRVSENIRCQITPDSAAAVGYAAITVLKGDYAVANGEVTVRVKAEGAGKGKANPTDTR